jgi:hypothetical protein
LKARITVDAFPDETLTGEITKVGVLPDSQTLDESGYQRFISRRSPLMEATTGSNPA